MERPLAVPLFSAILGLSLAGVFTYFLPPNVLPPLLAATFQVVVGGAIVFVAGVLIGSA